LVYGQYTHAERLSRIAAVKPPCRYDVTGTKIHPYHVTSGLAVDNAIDDAGVVVLQALNTPRAQSHSEDWVQGGSFGECRRNGILAQA